MGRLTGADNVAQLFPSAMPSVSPEDVRIAEALVFAAAEPLEETTIAQRLFARGGRRSGDGGIAAPLRGTRRQSGASCAPMDVPHRR